MNKIPMTYIFLGDRRKKLTENIGNEFPKEFFYSYFQFLEENNNLNLIEFSTRHEKSKFSRKYVSKFDKLFRKMTNLPFFSSQIVTPNNLRQIKKSEQVIMVGDRIACSLIFQLFLYKILRKKITTTVFVMGLFSNPPKSVIKKILQDIFLRLLIFSVSNFIFLGEGEKLYAEERFKKYYKKFYFLPFCIDTNFWTNDNDFSKESRKDILFIGNDGKREYKKVIEIARIMPNYNFTVITRRIQHDEDIPINMKLINGGWSVDNSLSDLEIKNSYKSARLTFIPLRDSLQPSGQSVTLQSMAMGTPVLISNTKGFWDRKNFIDDENIIFLHKNDVVSWKEAIEGIYSDEVKLKKLSELGSKLIKENYNLEIFHSNLKKILDY